MQCRAPGTCICAAELRVRALDIVSFVHWRGPISVERQDKLYRGNKRTRTGNNPARNLVCSVFFRCHQIQFFPVAS